MALVVWQAGQQPPMPGGDGGAYRRGEQHRHPLGNVTDIPKL
jgi:hypothetical protein